MLLNEGKSQPPWSRRIQQLWKSKVTSLDSLKEPLPGSTLVAFGLEGCARPEFFEVFEIGLAILQVDADTQEPMLCSGTAQFFSEHRIDARTIRVRDRIRRLRRRETLRWGSEVVVEAGQAAAALDAVLSTEANSDAKVILIGFDIREEMKWIAQGCPSISSYFTAWVDVQEFVAERYGGQQLNSMNAL
jgi:hypothetical protein